MISMLGFYSLRSPLPASPWVKGPDRDFHGKVLSIVLAVGKKYDGDPCFSEFVAGDNERKFTSRLRSQC